MILIHHTLDVIFKIQAAWGLHCIWYTKITSLICCEVEQAAYNPLQEHSSVRSVDLSIIQSELLCLPRSPQYFITSLPEVLLGLYPWKWQLCGQGSVKTREKILTNMTLLGKKYPSCGQGSRKPHSPKKLMFQESEIKVIYSGFCSSIIIIEQQQLFQTWVISSPPRGPVPEHRWNSSVENSTRKTVPSLAPKVWFWRTMMTSPLRPALLILSLRVFLLPRDLQSLEKQANGAKQTPTLILGDGYLG